MRRALVFAAALAGCAPEPQGAPPNPDPTVARTLEACRVGRKVGPACEKAQAAERARAAAARRALYRNSF